jgi:hypothetical protein
MPDPVLGHRLFADGVSRPVQFNAAGKPYVVGPDGERVPGVWLLPADVPSDAAPAPESPSRRPRPCPARLWFAFSPSGPTTEARP